MGTSTLWQGTKSSYTEGGLLYGGQEPSDALAAAMQCVLKDLSTYYDE